MDEHDVLDDFNKEVEKPLLQRRRSFRFLWYSLGIGLVVAGRFWLLDNSAGDAVEQNNALKQIFFLGNAGVWLFSGLGSIASLRAFSEIRIDFLQVTVLVVHLALLLWTSVELWMVMKESNALGF